MRTIVVIALQCHELHIEISVVMVFRLPLAKQSFICRPDEKFTEYSFVAGLWIALGRTQQVVVITIEVRGAA